MWPHFQWKVMQDVLDIAPFVHCNGTAQCKLQLIKSQFLVFITYNFLMVYFLLTVHVKQRPNTFFSLSSISPDNINNKKAFQLKANRPLANRYIVCVYICVYDWGGMFLHDQV